MDYRQECINMWQWVVDHHSKDKEGYLSVTHDYNICNDCYACESVVEPDCYDPDPDCSICPVDWGCEVDNEDNDPVYCQCENIESPYSIWCDNPSTDNARLVYQTIEDTWDIHGENEI